MVKAIPNDHAGVRELEVWAAAEMPHKFDGLGRRCVPERYNWDPVRIGRWSFVIYYRFYDHVDLPVDSLHHAIVVAEQLIYVRGSRLCFRLVFIVLLGSLGFALSA